MGAKYGDLVAAEAKLKELKDKAAADLVSDLIGALGASDEVTLEKEEAIGAARTAYDALTDEQKDLVGVKYGDLEAVEAKLKELKDQAAAALVDDLIGAIGAAVTLELEDAIDAARTAYDALTDDQKALLEGKYNDLVVAEAKLAELKDEAAAKFVNDLIAAIDSEVTLNSEAAIKAARTAYDALTENQKTLVAGKYADLVAAEAKLAELKSAKEAADKVAAADKAAATTVGTAIKSIGKVTLDSEAKIKAARAAYNALTKDQKALVTGEYADLVAAEEELAKLKSAKEAADKVAAADKAAAATVETAIKSIGKVTLDSETKIKAARTAYDKLTENQKKLVTNYKVLTDAEKAFEDLSKPAVLGRVSLSSVKSAGHKAVNIKWKKVTGANGYQVYRATSKNGKYKLVKDIKNTNTVSYKDAKLTTGKTYYYKVRAYKVVNNKNTYAAYSAVKKVKVVPATVKIGKIVKRGNAQKVSWKKVSGATGYRVYQATSKNGKYKMVKDINKGKTTSYTTQNLKNGKTYFYKVRAYRTVGGKKVYGSYSNVIGKKFKK